MDKEKLYNILEQRKSLHVEDPSVESYWSKMIDLLTENADETIELLMNCSKDDVLWFSEIFEDVAYELQNADFIECLEMLEKKYSDLPIKESIRTAKDYMK